MTDSPGPLKPTVVPQDLRIDYSKGTLDESAAAQDPMLQFARWFDDAQAADVPEVNAMTLATVSPSGAPSARIVLLKGYDPEGFVFFTSYDSRKAHELSSDPRAALVFYWQPMERQVRIEGTVERTTREESETYFRTRPREAQIGAWTSRQSAVLHSRAELEKRQAEVEKRFDGREIPLPDTWGGYRLIPTTIEFWQGRPARLHDRLRYARSPGGWWRIDRLSP